MSVSDSLRDHCSSLVAVLMLSDQKKLGCFSLSTFYVFENCLQQTQISGSNTPFWSNFLLSHQAHLATLSPLLWEPSQSGLPEWTKRRAEEKSEKSTPALLQRKLQFSHPTTQKRGIPTFGSEPSSNRASRSR